MRIVLIGGLPRTGTRQFCDIVNAHTACELHGEMDERVFRAFTDFVTAVDGNHAGRWMDVGYRKRRLGAILEAYRLFSKTNRNVPPDRERLEVGGFKIPGLEVHHAELEALFAPEVDRVTLFYCVRNIYANFNSLAGAFNFGVRRYVKRIHRSVTAVRAVVKDPFFDLRPLHLDGFVAAADKGAWVVEHIFRPIGIELDVAEGNAMLARVGNRNRTPDEKRRPGITAAEKMLLLASRQFVGEVRWLENHFGLQLFDP